jgi:hypothetical protein
MFSLTEFKVALDRLKLESPDGTKARAAEHFDQELMNALPILVTPDQMLGILIGLELAFLRQEETK